MDACLLDDNEWLKWQRIMKSNRSAEAKEQALLDIFQDGWEDWAEPEVIILFFLLISKVDRRTDTLTVQPEQDETDKHEAAQFTIEPEPSKAKDTVASPVKVAAGSNVKNHSDHKHSSKKQKTAAAY